MKYSHHQTKYIGKETSYSDRRFWVSYIQFIIIIGGILVLFIYIRRLASNEIFSPSNKIHREGNKLQRQKILSFIYSIYNHNWRNMNTIYIYNKTSIKRNILTIKQDTSEGNKLQRQKILSFIYPIYNHNWRNISTIYVYITRGLGWRSG